MVFRNCGLTTRTDLDFKQLQREIPLLSDQPKQYIMQNDNAENALFLLMLTLRNMWASISSALFLDWFLLHAFYLF